jgi:D-glycero-alpha-D-manno-heptose 1-phosphate guanylyltransferase
MSENPNRTNGLECVVLAGGLGTRLKDVVADVPKTLAPINNKAFLFYLLAYLERQRVSRVILALGYQSEKVEAWLNCHEFNFEIVLSVESEPLGTGGALKKALGECISDNVIFLNGDTYFDIDLNLFYSKSIRHKDCWVSLAILKLNHPNRYGTVIVDGFSRITEFKEKCNIEEGFINGGIGVLNKNLFLSTMTSNSFSLEKDFFEKFVFSGCIAGFEFNNYFIDIGVPLDYAKAQIDFK